VKLQKFNPFQLPALGGSAGIAPARENRMMNIDKMNYYNPAHKCLHDEDLTLRD